MSRYYVLSETQIDRLAETIKVAIIRAMKPLNLPEDQVDPKKAHPDGVKRGRGGRKRLSQIIYETMGDSPFTPKDAFAAIEGKYEFKGNRGLDSIRTSLSSDGDRFKKLDDGCFQKKVNEVL